MYERILVPTDGSAATDDAVERAIDLAKRYGAEVHALYVVETNVALPEGGVVDLTDAFERLGEEAVADVAERAEAAGVDVETAVAHGTAHRSILDYVEAEDVDLVVMSTHGRTGIDRYLLGSVTEKIVRLCDVPVLTVRMAGDEEHEE